MNHSPVTPETRVFVAEDQTLVKELLCDLIDRHPQMTVSGAAENGVDALSATSEADFDLLIFDICMPGMTGLQVAKELKKRKPSVPPIIFITSSTRESHLYEALSINATGYVHKSATGREFLEACRRAVSGQVTISAIALEPLIHSYLTRSPQPPAPITDREEQVLKLIAEGHTSAEIAETLFISPKTVERHRAALLDKLGMHDRLELCKYAIRNGLVEV